MSKLTATNKTANLGTNSKFTFTFSEGQYRARFLNITHVIAEDPKGSFEITDQVTPGPAVEFNWNPNDATFQSRVKDRKTFNINVKVQYIYEYQERESGMWLTIANETGVTITRTFTNAMAPELATGAFSVAYNNAGSSVSGVAGYVQNQSKIRATYNSSKVTLKTGASAAKWTVKFASASAVDVAIGTTYKDSAVINALGSVSVVCTLVDSRGFTVSQSLTAHFVPYIVPGPVTASNGTFGSAVAFSYGITSGGGSGGEVPQYLISLSVSGTSWTDTWAYTTSTSSSWTPALAVFGPMLPNSVSTTATITVKTYSGTVYFGTNSKTITLSFPNSPPTLSSGALTIAPVNAASVSGYIQGYSRIRATYNHLMVTPKNGATIASKTVSFNGSAAVAINTTVDSGVISAAPSVVLTVKDSRGFTSTQTATASMISYARPALSASASRVNSSHNPDDAGTIIKVTFTETYSAVDTGNTPATVKVQINGTSVGTYTASAQAVGTGKQLTGTYYYSSYSASTTHNVVVTASDKPGNTVSSAIVIPTETWAIHFMTGLVNNIRTVVGAAAGMVATVANRFQIPDTWKFYRGNHKVFDDGDVIGAGNGGTGQTSLQATRNAMGLGNTTGALPVANGGTGATDAAGARTNLGVGPQIDNTGIKRVSGQGQNNYFKIATITITGAYVNRTIAFKLSGRGKRLTTLNVRFASVNGTDPSLELFSTDVDDTYYMRKSATSVWELYGQYNEIWGDAILHSIEGSWDGNTTITVNMTNAGTTEPSNSTRASWHSTTNLIISKSSPSNIYLKNWSINAGTAPSSDLGAGVISFLENGNKNLSQIYSYYTTSKMAYIRMIAYNYVGSTSYNNFFDIRVNADGTPAVYISQPAAWRSAMGVVNKAGDTMTGSLTVQGAALFQLKRTDLDSQTAPSSNVYATAMNFIDKNDKPFGAIQLTQTTAGGNSVTVLASRQVNGTNYYNYVRFFVTSNGGTSIELSNPAAWLSALSNAAPTTTSTVSQIISLGSGWTASVAQFATWGKIGMLRMNVSRSTAQSSAAEVTVGTLVAGKRPVINTGGTRPNDPNKTVYITSAGVVSVYGSFAANATIAIVATYILA